MEMRSRAHKCIANNGGLMFNIHLSCWKRKFVQMLFGPFFMYIVENRGIKNYEAMEFVLLKWSIMMKISPKHCKILSTCDLGTKIL